MADRYFEVLGSTRDKVQAYIDKMSAGIQKARQFCKRCGAPNGHLRYNIGFTNLVFRPMLAQPLTPEQQKLWKPVRSKGWDDAYEPRTSTPEGKALKREMTQIEESAGGRFDIGAIIGMNSFGKGPFIYTCGLFEFGKRIILRVPNEEYNPAKVDKDKRPPKGEVVRISDLEFEQLVAAEEAAAAKKAKKQKAKKTNVKARAKPKST